MSHGPLPAATRSNLMRLRRRLDQVRRGAALLKKKRESLVAELFERARPAAHGRQAIDEQAQAAWRAWLEAAVTRSPEQLQAIGWPTRPLRVELEPLEVWGLKAFALTRAPSLVKSLASRALGPGPDDGAAVLAAEEVERLLELVVEAAPREMLMRRIGQALARTTRLVNTLEQRVELDLARDESRVRRTLDEREREEHLRLKRVVARRARR